MWTRITEMPDHELPRQAMYVQRKLFAAESATQAAATRPCWLSRFYKSLSQSVSGQAWWETWWSREDFRVRCSAPARVLTTGKLAWFRWETELLADFCARADADWLRTVSRPEAAALSSDNAQAKGGNKLRTYAQFKSEVKFEQYLVNVKVKAQRSLLAKLRMGVAPLRIETGRYERTAANDRARGVPVDQRTCLVCNCGAVEDEFHFVMECDAYAKPRECLLQSCRTDATLKHFVGNRCADSSTRRHLSNLLMSNSTVSRALAKFVWNSFRIRESIVDPEVSNLDG